MATAPSTTASTAFGRCTPGRILRTVVAHHFRFRACVGRNDSGIVLEDKMERARNELRREQHLMINGDPDRATCDSISDPAASASSAI